MAPPVTEVGDIQLQLTIHLSTQKGWKAELAWITLTAVGEGTKTWSSLACTNSCSHLALSTINLVYTVIYPEISRACVIVACSPCSCYLLTSVFFQKCDFNCKSFCSLLFCMHSHSYAIHVYSCIYDQLSIWRDFWRIWIFEKFHSWPLICLFLFLLWSIWCSRWLMWPQCQDSGFVIIIPTEALLIVSLPGLCAMLM